MKRPLKMLATPSAPPLSPVGSARDPLSGRLQQLGEELQCPLCLEYYEDPVALPCLHNFCRKCIGGAVKPSGANKQEVQCPLCRKKAYHDGSANSCVANLPRNFQIAGIVEKFRAAEKEKQRAEEEQFQPQVLEQIEEIREQQEHCSLQEQQQHRQKQQQGQQQLQEDQQAPSCTSSIDLYSPSNSVETTSANERVAPSSTHPPKIPQCKLCSYSSAFQCTECGEDFCLHCQQIHHHEGSIAFQEEFNSDELEKTASGPTSTPCDEGDGEEQQQHLQQLQEKQQHLQLELEQQRALSDFTPAPFWQQQQADRWEELQEKQGTRRQVSEEYPPRQHQSDGNSMPHEPLSWPLGHHSQEVYQQQHHRDLLQHSPASTVRYPHPEHQQQFSPYSLPSQLNCSHCKYPAAIRCEQCSSYFCWQCKGDLHDPYMCENHNTVDLSLAVSPSSPCIVGPEQDVKNYDFPSATRIPLVSIAPAVPNNVGTTSLGVERKLDYTLPFICDIVHMGPGKRITVFGKPYKEKCSRFHINLMCNKNPSSGDIALHFNPRFSWPKLVVRNSRVHGKYGPEERGGPSFPFKAGQFFKIEITCLIDKFKVEVDDKLFITYAHRIKDLRSITVFNVNGDVEITSVDGCM